MYVARHSRRPRHARVALAAAGVLAAAAAVPVTPPAWRVFEVVVSDTAHLVGRTPCVSPARLPDGRWSPFRTAGSMPSGSSRTLALTGDVWECRDGVVTVVSVTAVS